MAEEEKEVEKLVFGEEVKLGDPKWPQLRPEVGQIIEVVITPSDAVKEEAKVAILVTEVEEAVNGEKIYKGRYVGSDNESVGKYCSVHVNRKGLGLHLCSEDPCPGVAEAIAGHVARGAVWEASSFEADYMKTWGILVIKEFVKNQVIKRRGKPKEGRDPKQTKKSPKETKPRRSGRSETPDRKRRKERKEKKDKGERRDGRGDGRAPGDRDLGDVAGLRAKLDALRTRLEDHGEKEDQVVIDVEALSDREEPGEFWNFVAPDHPMKGLGTGDHLNTRMSHLALADAVKQEDTKDGITPFKKRRLKVRRSKLGTRKLGTSGQLLEVAEERQREKRKEKKRGKEKRGSRKVRALVKALETKKDRKRSREKGSPDPSSSGDSEEDSSEEGSSSSSTEMLAPLQKKSLRRPGAVLKMLTKHAQQTLDQTSVVEVKDGDTITQGVKMASYFNLLIRPYHPTNSRDMKELHYLSICIDELRSGKLGALGDSLASRFLAVHSAVNEGGWRTAQHLELHPLEGAQSAPTPLLLQARRHSKLIAKSQGRDEQERGWRRNDTYWKREDWSEQKGKGKGSKGGKNQYGKGKGRGSYGKQGGWQNWNQGGSGDKSDWWDKNKEKTGKEEQKEKKGEK